ncbi:hypothetical protein M514_11594 [Trichuris suis]|uniref:CCHC-type domain-containing protein n=1 Tax=Trichuris suis TaxID=68888 RepID=A0A085MSQ1_9BILA|nr:hypothetical protein M514_11594 [Trichuris suis]
MEHFVLGLRDQAAQQHLVDRGSMTLDEAVQAAKQFMVGQSTVREMRSNRPSLRGSSSEEDYRTHPKELHDQEKQSIMALLHSMDRRLSKLEVPGHGIERGNVRSRGGQNAAVVEQTRSRTNATCFVCASTGHFARQCPLRRQKQNRTDELAMTLMNASLPLENGHLPYVDVLLPNGMSTRALVDTGATATFAHENLVKHCRIPAQPFNQREVKAVDGARVCPKCTAQLKLTCLGKIISINALIMPTSPCLLALGMDALMMLGVTVELSRKGPLVKLANGEYRSDMDLQQVGVEGMLKDDSIATAIARVTYRDQLNKGERTEVGKMVKSSPQVSSSVKKAIREQVNEILKDGTVEKSKSSWCFPGAMMRSKCVEPQKKQKIVYDRGRKGMSPFDQETSSWYDGSSTNRSKCEIPAGTSDARLSRRI